MKPDKQFIVFVPARPELLIQSVMVLKEIQLKDLERLFNIKMGYISRMLNGLAPMKKDTFDELCKLLELDPATLRSYWWASFDGEGNLSAKDKRIIRGA